MMRLLSEPKLNGQAERIVRLTVQAEGRPILPHRLFGKTASVGSTRHTLLPYGMRRYPRMSH